MITKIGIVSGRIMELLEQMNGLFVFGEFQSTLKEPHDLVLMSLGWLLREGYIQILEDPSRACYINNDRDKYTNEAVMFDLIVENKFAGIAKMRIKHISHHIGVVAGEILTLLEGCGDLLALQTIERNLNEHRDIILMGLGWLIREGYVRQVGNRDNEFFISRLQKSTAIREEPSMAAICIKDFQEIY